MISLSDYYKNVSVLCQFLCMTYVPRVYNLFNFCTKIWIQYLHMFELFSVYYAFENTFIYNIQLYTVYISSGKIKKHTILPLA